MHSRWRHQAGFTIIEALVALAVVAALLAALGTLIASSVRAVPPGAVASPRSPVFPGNAQVRKSAGAGTAGASARRHHCRGQRRLRNFFRSRYKYRLQAEGGESHKGWTLRARETVLEKGGTTTTMALPAPSLVDTKN